MAKLAKREIRAPRKDWLERRKLKGFTKPQRSHAKLSADAKPRFGVAQEMPAREN